ncbi:MAG: hypothetical protein PHG63_02335 [Candidatus Dojkabacteria bacterium]|nr:hypothetical protein [Candidatus Dojkabacteria bacterium]
MQFSAFKRQLKSRLDRTSGTVNRRVPVLFISMTGLVLVVLAFCAVQLCIVSFLSPHGQTLVRLNEEKELLLEENRQIEQMIAERSSLSVVLGRAKEDLSLQRAGNVLYLRPSSVSAEARGN